MNAAFKIILEKALAHPLTKTETPLYEIFTKLFVTPVQRAWRQKTKYQKTKFGKDMRSNAQKIICMQCGDNFYKNPKQHSHRQKCERCYYQDGFRLNYRY
jgi:formylmethanofuran dehydrogenase subunit E